jgi:GAF domain-containing protein
MTATTDRLARVVLARRDLEDILREVAEIACAALGADSASITLIRSEPFTAAHVGQLALDADEMQYKRGHGPCLDAGRTGTVLLVPDMRAETRWPEYASEAARRGVLSSLSVPLPFQGASIGALNNYSREADTFVDAVEAGEEVAAFVAVAVGNADAYAEASTLAAQMQEAMRSRSVIDMAKGILIAQRKCTPDEAFRILSQASQRSNRKLRDIAEALVSGAQGDTKQATN